MGLVDSILGAMSGKGDASDQAGPLIGVLSGLLAQSGGLQGLANKFSQSGQGDNSRPGLVWAKTSRFPAIKFKTCLVPNRSRHSPQRWEWIRPKPHIS